MTPQCQRDDGQTSIFVIGATVIILLFALTIAAIMSVTLQHRKLLSLADSAAQSAATAFTVANSESFSLTITPDTATNQVNQHLSNVDAADRFPNLRVDRVLVTGDMTVSVQLSATAHPPVVSCLPAGVVVTAEGTARTQLTQ